MDLVSLRKREFGTTLNVLRAYPEDNCDMKPAEKCKTARELATTFAVEERIIGGLLSGQAASPALWEFDRPTAMPAIIALWQITVAENNAILEKLSAEELQKPVDFYGRTISLGEAVLVELLDHIHHRGQFSVYLRVAGAKVPSIYGPTADFPWP